MKKLITIVLILIVFGANAQKTPKWLNFKDHSDHFYSASELYLCSDLTLIIGLFTVYRLETSFAKFGHNSNKRSVNIKNGVYAGMFGAFIAFRMAGHYQLQKAAITSKRMNFSATENGIGLTLNF